MRGRRFVAITIVLAWSAAPRAADPPRRKPLDPNQRAALVVLMNAVDVAQQRDADADASVTWDNHILKSRDQTAYVPFRVTVAAATDAFKSTAMYVRAVSRHDGARTADEHSAVRDWLASRASDPRLVERALALPPGEYDVYVALLDRARQKASSPAILRRTVTIPDYWNDRLALSSLILVSRINTLKAPLSHEHQIESPYTLGQAEVVPVATHARSEEHTSELQSRLHLVCRLLLEKKKLQQLRCEAGCSCARVHIRIY